MSVNRFGKVVSSGDGDPGFEVRVPILRISTTSSPRHRSPNRGGRSNGTQRHLRRGRRLSPASPTAEVVHLRRHPPGRHQARRACADSPPGVRQAFQHRSTHRPRRHQRHLSDFPAGKPLLSGIERSHNILLAAVAPDTGGFPVSRSPNLVRDGVVYQPDFILMQRSWPWHTSGRCPPAGFQA